MLADNRLHLMIELLDLGGSKGFYQPVGRLVEGTAVGRKERACRSQFFLGKFIRGFGVKVLLQFGQSAAAEIQLAQLVGNPSAQTHEDGRNALEEETLQ